MSEGERSARAVRSEAAAGATAALPMRILVMNWNDRCDPHAGGAEVHLHRIFGRAAARGHQVTLLCNRPRGAARRTELDGMRVLRVGRRNTFNYHAPFAYYRHFRGRVDVVVDALNKLPLMVPLFAREPVVAIVHHLFGATALREMNSLASAYVGAFESLVPRVYRDCLVEVISDSTRDDLRRRGLDRDEQIRTVFCGLDQELYRPAADPAASRDRRPMLLFLGRIKRYKSVETIIEALPEIRRRLPETHLVIAGDGDDLPRLREIARSRGFDDDAVRFTGLVSDQEKVRLYRRAWLALMPSPKEGWGLTVVEASACGTAVLAADSPGLRESVVDGETGFLYPFGDSAACARHALRVLDDGALREKLGAAGRRWADRFTWEAATDATIALLHEARERHLRRAGGAAKLVSDAG